MPHQTLGIISTQFVDSNLSYGPEIAKLGFDLCDLDLCHLSLTLNMDISSVNDNSWRTDRQTNRQTDWIIHRAAWSQLKQAYLIPP